MKKNGFIATSLLYAFFLVFISLFVVLLLNFLHNRLLVYKINENARDSLMGINNRKIYDLTVGNFVKWKNLNPTAKSNPMNENGTWIVAKVEESGDEKIVYLMSDLITSAPSIRVALTSDNGVVTPHPMSLSVFNELNSMGGYVSSLKYYETHNTGMEIDIVNAGLLEEIGRSDVIDSNVKRNLFNAGEDYVIKIDDKYSSNGYTTTYNYSEGNMPAYYLYRVYNFNNYNNVEGVSIDDKNNLIQSYCGALYNAELDTIDYSYNNGAGSSNPFGYANIVKEKITNENNELIDNNYMDFCYNASPFEYTHNASDMVVLVNEHANSDLITTLKSYNYRLRLLMKVTVNKNADNIYMAGGKGISNDPYIITNGVKQS